MVGARDELVSDKHRPAMNGVEWEKMVVVTFKLTRNNIYISLHICLLETRASCLALIPATCFQCAVDQKDRMVSRFSHLCFVCVISGWSMFVSTVLL